MSQPSSSSKTAIVIGGGPAGLMAAERLRAAGIEVDLYDAMASVGRKFLLAGKGGLNLTHSEDRPLFDSRFAERSSSVAAWLDQLDGPGLRAWAAELGVDTFVGSSGRVFPSSMKAAPLLRAWLHRLRESGVRFHMRKRWLGWADDGGLRFASTSSGEAGELTVKADVVVLALGGASWPQLGSNGAWAPLLAQRGVDVAPLRAANCGFELGPRQDPTLAQAVAPIGWSELFTARFAGLPVKPVALHFEGQTGRKFSRQGEFVITEDGIEGSLVYAASALLREEIAEFGQALIHLDLLPDRSVDFVAAEVARPRGPRSLSTHLKSRLGIEGLKAGLLREVLNKEQYGDPATLAATLKRLPLRLVAARPVAEAISTAGGVRLEALSPELMLEKLPGLFCAGEMLDWEAPTGGYLLTASMASGRVAGDGAAAWLKARSAG
ncbi:BaiN/RdsA family NAD(P)/FAD-dependent oxidoreductase [Roseateles oligotrophus]|uniref:TIGR03862 family flavoprotein n=1 Tax=Roseateles oligotrophus TaxID=1769250 RepID=A0ABT2YGE0_9BURK|nr:TIGR03862 family flavoprotein [Roseateles oligotrophus]MCV2369088.1 TIGR03862 family flavoprotein [Roseateles oligotrophus]